MSIKMNQKIKRALILGLICGAALGIVITFAAANKVVNKKEVAMVETEKKLQAENKNLQSRLKQQETVEAAATLSEKQPDDWTMVLVNDSHPVDAKYVPELTEIAPGYSVDSRIAEDAKQMLSDGKAAGLKLYLCSAYRSYDDQKTVFNETMQDWINQGNSYIDAYNETKKSVAVPGYSEHALGLAVDIISEDYPELDDKQADTPEAKWLAENCYKYGFILRYPLDKADITGIIYEPWHYRYVGKDVAKEITEKATTLEEYLGVK